MAQLTIPLTTASGGNSGTPGDGSSGGSAASLTVVATSTFKPVQSRIPLGFALPAIGSTVDVTIAPMATATAIGFQVGDVVVIDRTINGVSLSRATFVVDAAPIGNVIRLRFQPVAGDAATGFAFAANSEITGQTRFPSIPATATYARFSIHESPELDVAYKTLGGPLNQIAINLMSGEALAYLNYAVANNPQMDLVTQRGEHIGFTGYVEIFNRADVLAARVFSTAPLAIAPTYFVVYKTPV
jgi:hypothetical protein